MIETMYMGRTILVPVKPIKVSKKILVPDDEKNATLKEGEVKENKLVTKKVIANFQVGTVVATGVKNELYKKGDTVVFKPNRAIEFDLIKGTIIVDDFDIIAPWVEDK